jgi:O-antigen ligase
MGFSRQPPREYETVKPSSSFDRSTDRQEDASSEWQSSRHIFNDEDLNETSNAIDETGRDERSLDEIGEAVTGESVFNRRTTQPQQQGLRRGHVFTYVSLLLFTLVLLIRPYDWYPNALTESLAYYLGVLTLGVFAVTQFSREGNFTARPREVYFVLALFVAAILSIPFADQDRRYAFDTFMDMFARAVLIFIILVNVVRTERRLRQMLWLSLAVGVFMAGNAVHNYATGNVEFEGYRVGGAIQGMLGNPNDLSQFLVAMVSIAVTLLCVSRGIARKIFYAVCILVLVAGIVVTFSRGGSLALAAVFFLLMWKLGKRHRLFFISVALGLYMVFLAAAPGEYRTRLLSIFNNDLEVAEGSADARRGLLMESVKVALRHPLLGIGMGNFRVIYKFQTHNSYTQVASEMGMFGFLAYLLFIITPIRRLREIEHATDGDPQQRRYYFMAIGLQALLVGYMVSSFFGAIAYYFHIYYFVGYAVSFRLIYYNLQGIPVEANGLPQTLEEEANTRDKRFGKRRLNAASELSAEAK